MASGNFNKTPEQDSINQSSSDAALEEMIDLHNQPEVGDKLDRTVHYRATKNTIRTEQNSNITGDSANKLKGSNKQGDPWKGDKLDRSVHYNPLKTNLTAGPNLKNTTNTAIGQNRSTRKDNCVGENIEQTLHDNSLMDFNQTAGIAVSQTESSNDEVIEQNSHTDSKEDLRKNANEKHNPKNSSKKARKAKSGRQWIYWPLGVIGGIATAAFVIIRLIKS